MSGSITYSISSAGGVIAGHEPESVIEAFCSLFGINQDKAQSYLSAKKLIRKDLTEAQAFAYRDKLTQIGLSVELEKHGEVADAFAGLSLIPEGDGEAEPAPVVSPGISAAPAAAVTAAAVASVASQSASGFSCPKCQLPQDKAEQCSGCGVYVDKYMAAQTAKQARAEAGVDEDAAAVGAVNKRIEADNLAWEGEYSFGYLPFAIGAAVVFGVIWYFLGKSVGEIRGVAWAFGALIGVVAAHFGSRGHMNGLVCAGLLLLSLSIGKFMLAGHYVDEIFSDDTDSSIMSEMETALAELAYMADDYDQINKSSNIELKRFMIEHEFFGSDASVSVTDISDEDADYFRQQEGAKLEYVFENREDYVSTDGSSVDLGAAMGTATRMAVFISLWGGLFPLLFIALGLGSAYRFGSGTKK